MLKKYLSVIICLCFAVAAAGCSSRDNPSESGEVVAQSPGVSSSMPEASVQEEPVSEAPVNEFIEDDEFYGKILLTYGGETSSDDGGKPCIRASAVSLFMHGGWGNPQELSAYDYYDWYLTMMWKEGASPEERQEKYKSPFGPDTGWFFPEELFEPLVLQYFEVPTEYLRSNPDVYSREHKGYYIGMGGGIGDSPVIVLDKVEKEGDVRRLYVRLEYSHDNTESRILTVKLEPNGGCKFQSYE